MKRIFHIKPIYLDFVWGGTKLIRQFQLETQLSNVGMIYMVIAIPNHLDNLVEETGEPLSVFYRNHPELFNIPEEEFPVRMAISCNEGLQSYQVHPNDSYALKHEGTKGKVSGSISLENSGKIKKQYFGHTANSLDEFKGLIENKDWDHFFTTIDVPDGSFLHTPAGVPHGGKGDGNILVTFASNSDITYRLYDFDRNDPNRPLHLQQVYDCANVPEVPVGPKMVEPKHINGIDLYEYYDVPGEYIAKRLVVNGNGTYLTNQFMFYGCYEGRGQLNGEEIKAGQTLFVPANSGPVEFVGQMDLVAISYRSRSQSNREVGSAKK